MRAGRWEWVLHNVEGFDLIVPTTYRDATQEKIEEKTGGCGPGGIGDWFVPDTNYGESIFLACQIHDWCYGEALSPKDKFFSDLIFWCNMTILVSIEDGDVDLEILDRLRVRRNTTYYLAVAYHGDGCIGGEDDEKITDDSSGTVPDTG